MNEYGFDYFIQENDPDECRVLTCVLGDGSVEVMSIHFDEMGLHGVALGETEKGEIGRALEKADNLYKEKPIMQILFDNPKSIDVFIDVLNKAKYELRDKE